MRLQVKSMGLFAASFLVMSLAVGVLAHALLLHEFEAIEKKSFIKDLSRLSSGLNYIKKQIQVKMSDWANWDDTYNYMADHNPAYIESNFSDSLLEDIRLNLISYWDTNGKLVFSFYSDPDSFTPKRMPRTLEQYIALNKHLFLQTDPDKGLSTWIQTEAGPMMISAAPILHTDHTGPIRGTMISGRFMNSATKNAVLEILDYPFMVNPYPPESINTKIDRPIVTLPTINLTKQTPHQLYGAIKIYDIAGKPILQLTTTKERNIYLQGQKVLQYFLISILVLGFITAALSYLLMELEVVNRIRWLGKQLRKIHQDEFKPLAIVDNKHDEISMLLKDVNEMLQRLEDGKHRLEASRFEAESASRAKSEFLANMSHELRTPLNGVIGMCQVMEQENLNLEQQDAVKTIEVCGQNLLTLINEILDFSKIEAGKMSLENISFNLSDWLSEIQRIARQSIEGKGLSFEVYQKPGIPNALKGDPSRLKQVVLNLLSNAAKFTETGHVLLSVDYWETDTPEKVLLFICVEDTGIGISEDKKQLIFTPFSQSDNSTSRKYGGTGLGLTISKRLIEMMGGELGLISQAGKGSVFWIHTYMEVAADAVEASETGASGYQKQNRPKLDLSVLLAEDNQVNQKVCKLILEKMGITVDFAANGKEVLAMLPQKHYDVILMDCQMPEMDGYQATGVIRQMTEPLKNIPIVALTANALEGDREKCLAAGMDEYLSKPINREQLTAVLSQVQAKAVAYN